MIFSIIILCLFISFMTHIVSLVNYVTKKSEKSLKNFIKTAISNVVLSIVSIVLVFKRPDLIAKFDFIFVTWVMAGLIMIFTLIVKIRIFVNIYRRSKLPENYHLNFFGKKVLHSTVVTKMEIVIFFGTMPFFLMSGSYFMARLVNFFLYKHL